MHGKTSPAVHGQKNMLVELLEGKLSTGMSGVFDRRDGVVIYKNGVAITSADSEEEAKKLVSLFATSGGGIYFDYLTRKKFTEFIKEAKLEAYITKNGKESPEHEKEYLVTFAAGQVASLFRDYMKKNGYTHRINCMY